MKAAACLQGYYEEDQVTEKAMQLHHAWAMMVLHRLRCTHYFFITTNERKQTMGNGNQQTEEERSKRS